MKNILSNIILILNVVAVLNISFLFADAVAEETGRLNELEEEMQKISQLLIDTLPSDFSRQAVVVVKDFYDREGNITYLCGFLKDRLIDELLNSGRFILVEKDRILNRVIGEIKFNESGFTEPEIAKHLRLLYGLDAIITGIVTVKENKITLTVFMYNVVTAKLWINKSIQFDLGEENKGMLAPKTASL